MRDKLLIQRSVTRIEPASEEGESLHKLEGIAHVPLLSPEAANLIEILAAVEVASESEGAAGARGEAESRQNDEREQKEADYILISRNSEFCFTYYYHNP